MHYAVPITWMIARNLPLSYGFKFTMLMHQSSRVKVVILRRNSHALYKPKPSRWLCPSRCKRSFRAIPSIHGRDCLHLTSRARTKAWFASMVYLVAVNPHRWAVPTAVLVTFHRQLNASFWPFSVCRDWQKSTQCFLLHASAVGKSFLPRRVSNMGDRNGHMILYRQFMNFI